MFLPFEDILALDDHLNVVGPSDHGCVQWRFLQQGICKAVEI